MSVDETLPTLVAAPKLPRNRKRSAYQRKWYRRRKKAGLCVRCGKGVLAALVFCEFHAAQRRKVKP